MPARLTYLKGEKNNRLTIIEEVESELQYNKTKVTPLRKIKCRCDCGNEIVTRLTSFKSGYVKSCGCLKNEVFSNFNKIDNTKHGLRHHSLYNIFASMKQRCYDINTKAYKNYGGRGVSICNEWLNDFRCFYDWAIENGWKKGLSIDRIDNNMGYEPQNCRFTTKVVQSNNRRSNIIVDISGVKMTLTQACKLYNINYKSINHLVKRGRTFEEAVQRYAEVNRPNN